MGLPGLESPAHLLLILAVVLLLFGAKRIPGLARSLGRGINEFKQGLNPKEEPAGGGRPPEEALEGERAGASPSAGGGGAGAADATEGEEAYGGEKRRQEGA